MIIVIIGLFSGIISAMGIGGGAILIPALIFFAGTKQHIAQSVNLISFLPIAAIALTIHYKNRNLNTRYAAMLILSGLAGAVAGSMLAVKLADSMLSKLFGAFLLVMGLYEILCKKNG
jgi:uncharacterized membrane protein YfcA